MVNFSLTHGYFPVAWKAALIDRRLKKRCQSASLSNLRPVRNLQFISRLTERAFYYQSQEHLVRSQLYPTLQSAYWAGHSTQTALLKVHIMTSCLTWITRGSLYYSAVRLEFSIWHRRSWSCTSPSSSDNFWHCRYCTSTVQILPGW